MTAADRAAGFLSHLSADAVSDALLGGVVRALMSQLEHAALVAHGDETLRPWQALTDPAVAPLWALPHAAQWTGGVMPPRRVGESDDDYLARARREVVYPRGMRRGSAKTVVDAAREHLTGEKAILFRERFNGDPWNLSVVTRVEETPDPDALREAILAVLPAGIALDHQVRDTRDWAEVADTWGSWAEVDTDNTDWREVLER